MADRPRRSVKDNKNSDFTYGSTEKAKTSRKQKQKDLEANPEILFGDLGGTWVKLEDTACDSSVKDVQFYTNNTKLWKREILNNFEKAYRRGDIPKPEVCDQLEFPQIKVKNMGGKCSMTVKFYDTGRVLIQGNATDYLKWCRSEFAENKQDLHQKGKESSNTSVESHTVMLPPLTCTKPDTMSEEVR